MDISQLSPLVVTFSPDDTAAATAALADVMPVEQHGRFLSGSRAVDRLHRRHCPWLLAVPATPEGDRIAHYWQGVAQSRVRQLQIPAPFRTLAEFADSGADLRRWALWECQSFRLKPQALQFAR